MDHPIVAEKDMGELVRHSCVDRFLRSTLKAGREVDEMAVAHRPLPYVPVLRLAFQSVARGEEYGVKGKSVLGFLQRARGGVCMA
jgi:hypothetical protein